MMKASEDGNCFPCPVCGHANDEQPWNGEIASFEICPGCGIQFGYDDACGGNAQLRPALYEKWRTEWSAQNNKKLAK